MFSFLSLSLSLSLSMTLDWRTTHWWRTDNVHIERLTAITANFPSSEYHNRWLTNAAPTDKHRGKNCKSSTNIWWQFHFSSLWVTSSIMMSYIWFILLLLYDHFLFYGRLTGSTEIRSFWRFNQSFVSSRSPEIRISSLLITDDISFTWNMSVT